MGLLISFSSMIWVPIYAIYFLIKTPGTLKERWIIGTTPLMDLKEKNSTENAKDEAAERLVEPTTIA